MPLRVNKFLIPKAVNWINLDRKFPLSTNMSKTAHRQTGFDEWKAFG